jgi:hypothetical protein
MSASQQLTEQQRTKLLTGYQGLPSREMVRYWLLAEEDVRSINARRREYNRLGFAVQLCVCQLDLAPFDALIWPHLVYG